MKSFTMGMLRQSGFFLWAAVILWLSLTPSPPRIDAALLSWDKFQHAVAFGVLALLGGAVFQPLFRSHTRVWLVSFLVALVFGIFIEAAQGTITVVRYADWKDVLADGLGAAVGCFAGWFAHLFRR